MRSCREIIRIVDSQEDLTLLQRMEVRMHLIICRRCLRFAKHLKIIKKSFRQFIDNRFSKVGDLRDLELRIIKNITKE